MATDNYSPQVELASKLASQISDYFNTYSTSERTKLLIEALGREHRTLQESFAGFVLSYIKHVSSPDYRYDGRNEYAHNICKYIVESWDSTQPYPFPVCLPLI